LKQRSGHDLFPPPLNWTAPRPSYASASPTHVSGTAQRPPRDLEVTPPGPPSRTAVEAFPLVTSVTDKVRSGATRTLPQTPPPPPDLPPVNRGESPQHEVAAAPPSRFPLWPALAGTFVLLLLLGGLGAFYILKPQPQKQADDQAFKKPTDDQAQI